MRESCDRVAAPAAAAAGGGAGSVVGAEEGGWQTMTRLSGAAPVVLSVSCTPEQRAPPQPTPLISAGSLTSDSSMWSLEVLA